MDCRVLRDGAGLGHVRRARRQLVASLRERAERAEAEQRLLTEQARHAERTRIAREMHDVLAQRVSLVALHAGGLEMRPSLPPDEVRRTAGVIRTSARQALEELRDVIGLPAPHAPATVSLRGGPGKGLQVDVRNPLPRAAATALPGAGSGLVGLAERVTLAGGTLSHGPSAEGQFVVAARLRWAR